MTFSERILSSALKSWGGVASSIGILGVLISWFIVPATETIKLNIFLVVILSLLVLIGILSRAVFDANNDSKVILPRVKAVIDPPSSYIGASALLLLEPTELLAYDSVVSIYYVDGGIEHLSGIGKVVNIQNDKKVQVVLFNKKECSEKIEVSKFSRQDEFSKLIVKPSIPSYFWEDL